MDRNAISDHIEQHLDEHVAHIQRWVRQRSVSWDNMGVAEMADVVADSYRDLGCEDVQILEGKYHPGVWAYYDAGAPVTVHNYCMFDTRTVRHPDDWSYDPWGARLVDADGHNKVLVGRGSMGAKGPYVAWLNALSSIIAVEGSLPVNIMFLAEGAEIMGSPSYNEFVSRFENELEQVDASFCPSAAQAGDGSVSVGLGLKGMLVIELTASGESWDSGPVTTLHSATAPLFDSPPFRLAQALSTLTDEEGKGCKVDGLEEIWAYRKPLTDEERALLDGLMSRFEGRGWSEILPLGSPENVERMRNGSEGMSPLIEYLYGPSFNIAGLRGGFLGPNTSTIPFIIPESATAMLDMRTVVDASAHDIVGRIREHLDARGFQDIEIDVYAAYDHSQTSVSDSGVQAVVETVESWNLEPVVWPIQAGGGPWTAVPNAFDVPCVRGGVIGGGRRASVDEYMIIESGSQVVGLADMEKYIVDLLFHYADRVGGNGR